MSPGPFSGLAFGPTGWSDELLAGAWVTVRLAATALPFGLAIGLGVALLKQARAFAPRALGEAYTTVFRGLPELLTVFIVFYGAPRLMNSVAAFASETLGLGAAQDFGIDAFDAFAAGAIALALVLGAFSSEVFSGAIRGVPDGQREAAAALGLSDNQEFRLVILPQVWRLALPGLGNNWLTLLKDTSLVSVIALPDLMRQSYLAALSTKQPFLFYSLACLIYLALSVLSGLVLARLERSAARGLATAAR